MQPLEGIIGLCARCHVVTHGRFDHPEAWNRYVTMVRDGWLFPPPKSQETAIAEMLNRTRSFDVATAGPARGRTVLDEIADGRWLDVGNPSRRASASCQPRLPSR